ncbi:MAG: tRNA 2-thiouridine(34) synthase MnmA [Gammaproteobacteria bacterium]|nr:MAG: tRNA 2-thiouridine(34) synthase MnmA [Gammaproteobacteria bacterium]
MTTRSNDRIVVGLSGGVDSSVAALILKDRGLDVHGLFMTNWEEDEEGYCQNAQDYQDANAVAERLDIPLHRVNFARQYRDRVFDYFLHEYRQGRTPNPDILCNREIKFGVFLDYARRLGASKIATGHYARSNGDGKLRLARDTSKDQTYFLHAVHADALRDSLFPIGGMLKSEVRELAKHAGLPTHDKPDSTGICFIGERPFRDFLSRFMPALPGEIHDPEGKVLGSHSGLMYYTIGQRQGLGIGGHRQAEEAPWYVADKDVDKNVLTVVQGHGHPRLLSPGLIAGDPHWISGRPPRFPLACRARVRHRQSLQSCTVEQQGEQLRVRFEAPQRAIAPGQFIVFYDDDTCLGGGTIVSATLTGKDKGSRDEKGTQAA